MELLETIVSTLKKAGIWAVQNPGRAINAVQQVESLCSGKKYEPSTQADRILVLEQRVRQLHEKTEKQDKKIDALQHQIRVMEQTVRKLRIWLTVSGVALAVAVVAVAVVAVLL